VNYRKVVLKERNDREGIIIDKSKMVNVDMGLIAIRTDLELARKAFFLSQIYDWAVVRDSSNSICLIPTEKGGIG
jgi:hypothetical protein